MFKAMQKHLLYHYLNDNNVKKIGKLLLHINQIIQNLFTGAQTFLKIVKAIDQLDPADTIFGRFVRGEEQKTQVKLVKI